MLIGDVPNGNAYCLFELPDDAMRKEDDFYFYDDKKDIVTFIRHDGTIMIQYRVKRGDKSYMEELNNIYDKYYEEKRSIKKDQEQALKFQKFLYRAMYSVDIEEEGRWFAKNTG